MPGAVLPVSSYLFFPNKYMIDVLLSPAFFLMRKLRHREIVQLAKVIEPELEARLLDCRVTIPHGFSCVRKTC